jgi:hypothetical protein
MLNEVVKRDTEFFDGIDHGLVMAALGLCCVAGAGAIEIEVR